MSEGNDNEVVTQLAELKENIKSLKTELGRLPARVVEAGAMPAVWVLTSLILTMIFLLLSVTLIFLGVLQDNKIDIHEACLLGLVFIGLAVIAIMLARTLVKRNE